MLEKNKNKSPETPHLQKYPQTTKETPTVIKNNREKTTVKIAPITQELIKYLWDNNIFFATLSGQTYLKAGQNLYYSNNAQIEEYTRIREGNCIANMGSFSYTRTVFNPGQIDIGRYCSFAKNIRIFDQDHPMNSFSTSTCVNNATALQYKGVSEKFPNKFKPIKGFFPKQYKIVVEDDVWIGDYAALKPGITLHTGCVVATGAVVTKDVPPYAIVGGNPARVLKYRFPDNIIEDLLETQWWKYCFAEFEGIAGDTPIDEFIDKFNNLKFSRRIQEFKPKIITADDIEQFTKK
jgi:acetyltransferase-like isoleucine patch superfamily enzyme